MKSLKNILESSSIVFAYIDANLPLPCHNTVVSKVRELSESLSLPSKIFINSHDKVSSSQWFEKMFDGISFEETSLQSTQDIYESLSPLYKQVKIVDQSSKAILFEGTDFIGVTTSTQTPSRLFKDFREAYYEFLNESDTRKLFSLFYPPKSFSVLKESISQDREKFYSGELFKIKSIVEDTSGVYEVIDRGSNYVVVTDANGNISKKFPNSIAESSKRLEYSEGIFKGYKPSEAFMAREDVVESFKKTIDDYNNGIFEDAYAVLKSLKCVDGLLNNLNENVGSLQHSLNRINQSQNHSYLEEMTIKNIQNQMQAAKIIADAVGSSDKGSPTEIANNAIRHCVKHNNSTQKQILRKMLQTAEKVGLTYDKSLLESSDPLYGEIHRDHKNLKSKTTDEILKDHKDLRKIGVDYAARDVGGKREMIKDILSHNYGNSKLKSYKSLKSQIRKSMDEETIDELNNDTLKSYHRKAMMDTITGKKNRTDGMSKALVRTAGLNKPLIENAKGDEEIWRQNPTATPTTLKASKGQKIVDKRTKKTVSTHKTLSDAIQARKKMGGNSDTHSIEAISEVHLDPDYKEEIDILGYDGLKKKLAQATGIANYGDQEPGKPITLVDLQGNKIKENEHNKPGSSFKDVSDHVRKMKLHRHHSE